MVKRDRPIAPDLSGSGRVDMPTRSVTARWAAVATGESGKIHIHVFDTWRCGSLSFMFTRPPEDLQKNDRHIKREPQLRMVASSDSVRAMARVSSAL